MEVPSRLPLSKMLICGQSSRSELGVGVPQGFGTCDLIVVINGTVYVVDLKFGTPHTRAHV